MPDRETPRVIPFVRRWGVGISGNSTPCVIDDIGASKEGLVTREIEVELARVRVLTNRSAGVESESAGIHAVADRIVVHRIPGRCCCQRLQCGLVQTLDVRE